MITNTSISSLQAIIFRLEKQVVQLQNKVVILERENAELKAENKNLKSENLELRRRLSQNSKNSNKPPSSDFIKPKPALPKKTKGRKGGQVGHKGKTLDQIENPDFVVRYPLAHCECGCDLSQLPQTLSKKRQVFDIPDPGLKVTEHQILKASCPNCGKQNSSVLPEHIKAPTQYGFGVKTLVTLLNNEFKLPFNKVQLLFADLFGYTINEGTITSANKLTYERLEDTMEVFKALLIKSLVAHADETGVQVNGILHWLHSLSTEEFTYLFVHPKRGTEAMTSAESILPELENILVHDCWASYFNFEQVDHALCGAHLLRELEGLIEDGSIWAGIFKKYLLGIYEKSTPLINNRGQIENRYDLICKIADLEEPPPAQNNKRGRKKKTKGRNLLERLIKHKEAVLRFAFVPEVPFTNNLAERDIRHTKLKQKVSGGFRTFRGAQIYARIQSFISTLRKQGLNVFTQLRETLEFKRNFFIETPLPAK